MPANSTPNVVEWRQVRMWTLQQLRWQSESKSEADPDPWDGSSPAAATAPLPLRVRWVHLQMNYYWYCYFYYYHFAVSLFFPTCWSVAGLDVTRRLRRRHVTAWLIQNSVFQCFCSLWLLLVFSSSYVFNPRSQSKYFEEQNTFKILNLNVFNASKH